MAKTLKPGDAPANGEHPADIPDPAETPASEAVRAAEPPKTPERLKLSTLARLEPGRPVLEIDGRVYSFANPLAFGALKRNHLAELFERLGQIPEITTPELEAEHLAVLVEIAGIALPDVPVAVLEDLGDVQLDAVTGAFFVDAAGALPARRIARLLGIDGASRNGPTQSRGSNVSTARPRRKSGS